MYMVLLKNCLQLSHKQRMKRTINTLTKNTPIRNVSCLLRQEWVTMHSYAIYDINYVFCTYYAAYSKVFPYFSPYWGGNRWLRVVFSGG